MVLKDIPGYEGLYKASDTGRIWSCISNRFLLGSPDKDGYLRVLLYPKNNTNGESGRKSYRVHRLVALTFIENKNKYPQVNHKDENKKNNAVSNLEWCTARYNNMYNGLASRRADKTKKIVYATNGINVLKFNSLKEAADGTGADISDVSTLCTNPNNNYKRLRSTKGWTFSFTKKFPKARFIRKYAWYTFDGFAYKIYPTRSLLEQSIHMSHSTFMHEINTGNTIKGKEFCIGRDPV